MSTVDHIEFALRTSLNAAQEGDHEKARTYAALAQAEGVGLLATNAGRAVTALDRIASVVNGGRSWR